MDKTEARLKRIEGQIAGIRKMYKQERECMEIAQQVAAVRSALASVGREILSGEAIKCSRSEKDREKFAKLVERLFEMS
jgi:DNA-binding FrmR family transcriptional regulator